MNGQYKPISKIYFRSKQIQSDKVYRKEPNDPMSIPNINWCDCSLKRIWCLDCYQAKHHIPVSLVNMVMFSHYDIRIVCTLIDARTTISHNPANHVGSIQVFCSHFYSILLLVLTVKLFHFLIYHFKPCPPNIHWICLYQLKLLLKGQSSKGIHKPHLLFSFHTILF